MNTFIARQEIDSPTSYFRESILEEANKDLMPPPTNRNADEKFYPEKIFLDNGKKMVGLDVSDIAYCKASRDYTTIVTSVGEQLLSSRGIGTMEKSLDPRHFIRIHRSYIINLRHVKLIKSEFSRYYFNVNSEEIPVSRYYLPIVKQYIF